jgi:hypothetical protein
MWRLLSGVATFYTIEFSSLSEMSRQLIADCSALRLKGERMLRTLPEEHGLSDIFVAYAVERHNRAEADLIGQLFHS